MEDTLLRHFGCGRDNGVGQNQRRDDVEVEGTGDSSIFRTADRSNRLYRASVIDQQNRRAANKKQLQRVAGKPALQRRNVSQVDCQFPQQLRVARCQAGVAMSGEAENGDTGCQQGFPNGRAQAAAMTGHNRFHFAFLVEW